MTWSAGSTEQGGVILYHFWIFLQGTRVITIEINARSIQFIIQALSGRTW